MEPIKAKVSTVIRLDGRQDQGERGATLQRSQAVGFIKIVFDPEIGDPPLGGGGQESILLRSDRIEKVSSVTVFPGAGPPPDHLTTTTIEWMLRDSSKTRYVITFPLSLSDFEALLS